MKQPTIVRSKRAEDDLFELWLQIAERDFAAAERFLDRVAAAERRLLDHPELGTRREALGPSLRVLIVGIDLLFYRIEERTIRILRVFDGRRNVTPEDLAEDSTTSGPGWTGP